MKLGVILQPPYPENLVSSEFQAINLHEWLPEKLSSGAPEIGGVGDFTLCSEYPL